MPPKRCTATVRSRNSEHYGERCRRAPIPCGEVCVKHGGYLPSVRAKAERTYLALLAGWGGYLPEWRKAELVRHYERAQRAYSAKLDKKYSRPLEPRPSASEDPTRGLLDEYLTPEERARFAEQARRIEQEDEEWWQ